ncbi:tyrosine-type recombinase/integrase [Sorangium sp. So ce124]|uniref:tyrosine-type recombinase/integrase n=1 Tax=Sorangium sp. So ce124 TaxID=3133280 RepID=UPI003F5E31A8
MATKAKDHPVKLPRGNVEGRNGSWSLRVRLGGERKRIPLGSGMSEAKAREKADAWLERMAREGYTGAPAEPAKPAGTTVREHFDAWVSGELYRTHGAVNGLRIKASADVDGWRARRYIYPAIGDKLVPEVTEQDIDRVMARIPEGRRPGTRMKVYALLSRGFDLAVMPARLRKDNPVTRYHRPANGAPKLFAYLFPAELLALLKCAAIPLGRRVLYALAVYTMLRKSSLYALTWSGVDIASRTLLSKVSKNGLAQLFEIPAGLAWVLRRWRAHLQNPSPSSPVIPREELGLRVSRNGEAETLREDLRIAGIKRAALFVAGGNVEPLRFHDLRATGVTWAKRAGRGDGWIADRTGHLTPEMLDRYTRAARTLEDLRIEPFPDLTGTIPELARLSGEEEPPHGGATPSGGATPGPEGGPTERTHAHLDAANRGGRPPQNPGKSRSSRRIGVPCGSSCRGFDSRYSPQIEQAEASQQRHPWGLGCARARRPSGRHADSCPLCTVPELHEFDRDASMGASDDRRIARERGDDDRSPDARRGLGPRAPARPCRAAAPARGKRRALSAPFLPPSIHEPKGVPLGRRRASATRSRSEARHRPRPSMSAPARHTASTLARHHEHARSPHHGRARTASRIARFDKHSSRPGDTDSWISTHRGGPIFILQETASLIFVTSSPQYPRSVGAHENHPPWEPRLDGAPPLRRVHRGQRSSARGVRRGFERCCGSYRVAGARHRRCRQPAHALGARSRAREGAGVRRCSARGPRSLHHP